jgi:hypothetical protein
MNKYTLSFVKNEEKLSKAGKKYVALSVKIKDDPEDRWYNGLGNDFTKTWNVGDTVPLELYEEEYNGKMFWKVRALSKTDLVVSELEELKGRVRVLESRVGVVSSGQAGLAPAPTTPSTPAQSSTPPVVAQGQGVEKIDVADLPF